MTLNFGEFYTVLDENGDRTNDIYKCIGIAHDYLQTDNDIVLMCKINDNGYVGDILYTPIEDFLNDFEEIR